MDGNPIKISVDEAVRIGIGFLMHGQVRDADHVFQRILLLEPDEPNALHYAGVAAHRLGRTDDALAMVRRSLDLVPEQPDWHSNHGIILENAGRGDEAIEEFRAAIGLRPGHANAHNNLGVLERLHGQLAEAEASFRTAIELDAEHADAYRNLAVVLDQTGRTRDAVVAYCKALTIEPSNPEAKRMLAMAYCTIGDRERAVGICEEWVRQSPEDPIARHTLAACSQRDIPARASDAFIAASFDSFAETFEAKLTRLEYKAPSLVVGAVAEAGRLPDGSRQVLDAGCGTGWCGPLLKPYAARLVGVDLSEGMLKHAAEKQVYDELVHAELVTYLEAQVGAFDIVVSADTLVYFGALDAFAMAASGALRPGGLLVFTVEAARPETDTFQLEVHGRYNHAASYVEAVLKDAGLSPVIAPNVLRNESGLPVDGLVVRAEKPTGDARG